MDEDLIEKWGSIGFLDGLSEIDKIRISLLFERTARHIIDLDLTTKSYGENITETVIFVIIRRIIVGGGNIHSVIRLYTDLVRFFNVNKSSMEELQREAYFNIDVEAEYVIMYADDYLLKQYDPIKPIKTFRHFTWTK